MKKELLACHITQNGDYLVLVKWQKPYRTEYIVAYSWNPSGIATGESDWCKGRYFGCLVDADREYFKLLKQELSYLNTSLLEERIEND